MAVRARLRRTSNLWRSANSSVLTALPESEDVTPTHQLLKSDWIESGSIMN